MLCTALRQDVVFGDVTSKEVLAYFTMHGASMSWEDKVRADVPVCRQTLTLTQP